MKTLIVPSRVGYSQKQVSSQRSITHSHQRVFISRSPHYRLRAVPGRLEIDFISENTAAVLRGATAALGPPPSASPAAPRSIEPIPYREPQPTHAHRQPFHATAHARPTPSLPSPLPAAGPIDLRLTAQPHLRPTAREYVPSRPLPAPRSPAPQAPDHVPAMPAVPTAAMRAESAAQPPAAPAAPAALSELARAPAVAAAAAGQSVLVIAPEALEKAMQAQRAQGLEPNMEAAVRQLVASALGQGAAPNGPAPLIVQAPVAAAAPTPVSAPAPAPAPIVAPPPAVDPAALQQFSVEQLHAQFLKTVAQFKQLQEQHAQQQAAPGPGPGPAAVQSSNPWNALKNFREQE